MSNRRDTETPRADRALYAALWLVATAIGCALVLFAVPRPSPLELPVLMLDMQRVRAQLAQDAEIAAREPSDAARALYELLLLAGRAELSGEAPPPPRGVASARGRLEREAGAEAVDALCTHATQRFMRALTEGGFDEGEDRGLIGAHYALLLHHGYVSASGGLLAPELSLRATYKVRCNLILGRAPTEGLSTVERQAYEGFRGLEAHNLSLELRHAALVEYLRAGGGASAERALAIVEAEHGEGGALLARLANVPGEAAQLRLRNMALSLMPRVED